jgi:ABC-2 type transport system permease protein
MKPLATVGAVRLVCGRELRQRLRSRGFRVGTVIIAVLASALALLPSVAPDLEDRTWTLAVIGSAPATLDRAAAELAQAESASITVRRVEAGDPATVARRDGVDAVLAGGRRLVVAPGAEDALVRTMTQAVVRSRLMEQFAEAGAAEDALAAARDVRVRRLGDAGNADVEFVTFLGVLALFFAIATYGAWVLYSVLEEKANRVVEIVISTVSPHQLLAGKVIGNGVAGLIQFTIVISVAAAAGAAAGGLPDLATGAPLAVVTVIGWFVLGFMFYAVGYAAAGSLVSRQEDAQSAVTPMMSVVLTGYLVSLLVVNPDPGSTAALVVSLLPPVTPMAMPVRIAAGEAAGWQIVLAVALMLAATWAMIRVAARIYAGGLLRSGARVRARDALRGERPGRA